MLYYRVKFSERSKKWDFAEIPVSHRKMCILFDSENTSEHKVFAYIVFIL